MDSQDTAKAIKLQFKNAVNLQQTCKIYLATAQEDSWSFYFQKGCLIWATSSIHRFNRLYRLTNQVVPALNCDRIKLREKEISEIWEYLFISVLQQRQKISAVQAEVIVHQAIKEVLFDCLLAVDNITKIKTIFETEANNMGAILRSPLFKNPIFTIDYQKTLNKLELLVSDWNNLEIKGFTPNLAPVILDMNKLTKAVDYGSYQQLYCLINGQKSIRNLAAATKCDLLDLTNCLIPHIKNKAIALQTIPDRQLENLYFAATSQAEATKYGDSERKYIRELELPLVVIVDDNPHTCQKTIQILNPFGYRAIAINDPAKALIALLENKPDLVILNAEMPDANGYEICAQIKKMPDLKNIPVIILQNKKSMVDTVKARMSGASAIVEKSLKVKELLMLAQKYTQTIVEPDSLSA